MRRKGIIGSVLSFLFISILLVAFYRANNGDVVGGAEHVLSAVWGFISRSADSLLSFEWFRNLLR